MPSTVSYSKLPKVDRQVVLKMILPHSMKNSSAAKLAREKWGRTYSAHTLHDTTRTTTFYAETLKGHVKLDQEGVELMVKGGYKALSEFLAPALHRTLANLFV
jgi:hypothetical protein